MTQSADRWESYVDSLKLNESQFQDLVIARHKNMPAKKDSRPDTAGSASRDSIRVRIRGALWIPAELRETGGNTHRYRVYPVDISSSGACFLVGRFFHQGTACDLTFQLADGELMQVNGKVVRCNFMQGRVHEVGINFDSKFDMDLISPEISGAAVSPAAPAHEGESNHIAAPVRSAQDAAKLHAIAVEMKSLADRLLETTTVADRIRVLGNSLQAESEQHG